jgi:glycosyltransferase involved in cell wall biosynthesis
LKKKNKPQTEAGGMKKITVVIPAYNAHDTIERTLYSIVNQSMAEQLQVIIVNDKSKKGYEQITKRFKKLIDIDIINMEVNEGPGVARQKGLEACQTPYITFIDGDDIYIDGLFMEGVVRHLDEDPNCTNVNVMFLEERGNSRFSKHDNDVTWVFGKVYRVSYLIKNNIGFSKLRANEDLEFNMKLHLLQQENEYTHFVNDKQCYLWRMKEDSITRVNDREYSYHQGLIGALEAKMKAFDFKNVNSQRIKQIAAAEVPQLYNNYISIIYDRPDKQEWLEAVFTVMVQFYHKYARDTWVSLHAEEQAYLFNQRNLRNVQHIIPPITFEEFMAKLEAKQL